MDPDKKLWHERVEKIVRHNVGTPLQPFEKSCPEAGEWAAKGRIQWGL